MVDPNAAWAVAFVTVAAVGYVAGWRSHPRHREGCAECAADIRRRQAAERDARHDAQHRGPKAPGLPYPTEDLYDCADIRCPRNKRNHT